jgi:cytochrome c5
MKVEESELKKQPCPNCDRKGLHYANHPHAFGYKDVYRMTCRFCHEQFITDELTQYFNGEIHVLHKPKVQ